MALQLEKRIEALSMYRHTEAISCYHSPSLANTGGLFCKKVWHIVLALGGPGFAEHGFLYSSDKETPGRQMCCS